METPTIIECFPSASIGKFKNLKNYKNTNLFEFILSFITIRESVCILMEVNRFFLNTITTIIAKYVDYDEDSTDDNSAKSPINLNKLFA